MANIPAGAVQMDAELGRRVRSFLEQKEWWDIVQKLRADLGTCAGIPTFVLAGIAFPSADDIRFANAVNWCVGAQSLSLSNVLTYSPGPNWYYLAAPAVGQTDVWGYVVVSTKVASNLGMAQMNATAFTTAVLSRITGVPVITAVQQSPSEWEIAGQVSIT